MYILCSFILRKKKKLYAQIRYRLPSDRKTYSALIQAAKYFSQDAHILLAVLRQDAQRPCCAENVWGHESCVTKGPAVNDKFTLASYRWDWDMGCQVANLKCHRVCFRGECTSPKESKAKRRGEPPHLVQPLVWPYKLFVCTAVPHPPK